MQIYLLKDGVLIFFLFCLINGLCISFERSFFFIGDKLIRRSLLCFSFLLLTKNLLVIYFVPNRFIIYMKVRFLLERESQKAVIKKEFDEK